MNSSRVSVSNNPKGVYGVVGHVGVGHVHSHNSFVQDDSAGFAVVASLMREALEVDTRIKKVLGDPITGTIMIETYGGGVGKTFARRGITPSEADLLNRAVNEDGIYTQSAAVKTFGRMYGQGVMETPVALQGAIALAVLDSFYKKAPDKVHITMGKYEGRIDKMASAVINIGGIDISLLLNINGSEGGVGPDEDNEGNTALGEKAEIMKAVGLDSIPTIIVESKANIPAIGDKISQPTFMFRAQEKIDDITVANALVYAAEHLEVPYILSTDVLPQVSGQLAKATADFADRMITLGEELKKVNYSADKVRIIAEMAKLISEDAGGISFMSNNLHEEVRGVGIVPGTSAVISLLVPVMYKNYWKIPMLDASDIDGYRKIILYAISKMFSENYHKNS